MTSDPAVTSSLVSQTATVSRVSGSPDGRFVAVLCERWEKTYSAKLFFKEENINDNRIVYGNVLVIVRLWFIV